jgi:hypothetical protein
MKNVRDVIVFNAADLHAESASWAGILDGQMGLSLAPLSSSSGFGRGGDVGA